jgi:hypothetical protein
MHGFQNGLLFCACLAMLLSSPATMAFEPQVASRLSRRLPFVDSLSNAAHSDQARSQERCHVSGADVQRIERSTSDPCLASESVPGGVCFARLGQSLASTDSADPPHNWQRHCGT